MMHAANPEKSGRLKRVLYALRECPSGITSLALQQRAETVAPGTCVSELRRAGYKITCRYLMKRDGGAKVYIYKLEGDRHGR